MGSSGDPIPIWLSVVGTWFVALIALFGQAFWTWVRRPRLRLALLNSDGDLEVETLKWVDAGGVVRERQREARYYRLRVLNEQRASAVQDVQIVVDTIEVPLPNDRPRLEYSGPIPLTWQHPNAFPQFRSVGTPAVADFLVVTDESTLRLATNVIPNKYKEEYVGDTRLWVTVAARGRELDSAAIRFRIHWDGLWERGALEMRNHLTIEQE